MKIVRGLFFVVLVLVILLPYSITESGDYEDKVVSYVALGDSIAKGYGLKDTDTESYVGRITEALDRQYAAVRVTNFGENGLRSDELLKILTDPADKKHDAYLSAIKGADLITLSIGSNDLLQYISRETDLDEFKKKGDRLFRQACEEFQKNIPEIIDVISDNAPQAQLFVNNIYNPCHDISFDISEKVLKNLDQMAEKYIVQINEGFETEQVQSVFNQKNKGSQKEYVLVDVKRAFEDSSEKLLNMVITWGEIDPHPNKEGHRVIAELIIPQISLDKGRKN
ncbi:MAG: GDSL-type esterase/lipase family protein [Roseburia sp.]|nr:GDSL-type esterase/lipase family protein [Roseburia sp.]